MNILHITPSYKPAYVYGGPIFSVSRLSEALVANGQEVYVYTTLANGVEELPYPAGTEKLVDGVRVTYFKRITKDHTHFSLSLLNNVWKECKIYDVVHIHAWWNLVSLAAMFICRLRGVKVVLSPRGMLSDYTFGNSISTKRLFHSLIGKRLLKKIRFHATSNLEALEIERQVHGSCITVIPNLMDLSNVPNKIRSTQIEAFSLVYFSRIHPKKGLEILFSALTQVKFKWTLTIAGHGHDEYIKHLKKQSILWGLDNNINWAGPIKQTDKFNFLSHFDLLVLPSQNENFANVVIEALSVGTPVLVSNKVGLAAEVLESGMGWVCETEIQSLKDTLNEAYLSVEKRRLISKKSIEWVMEKFDSEILLRQYMNLYKS